MITKELLEELFFYDDGKLIRKVSVNNQKSGTRAGGEKATNNGKSYRYIGINGKRYLEHRIIWFLINGNFPKDEIDHINGDGCDNRIENLRDVCRDQNHKNYRLAKNNTSGHIGVSWYKLTGRWKATIKVNRKNIHLGYFYEKKDAIEARKYAELKYGFHKNHGQNGP